MKHRSPRSFSATLLTIILLSLLNSKQVSGSGMRTGSAAIGAMQSERSISPSKVGVLRVVGASQREDTREIMAEGPVRGPR